MNNQFDNYDNLVDISRIIDFFHTIRLNTKHRDKILVFELFFSCNIFKIYQILKNKSYFHGRYNVFLLRDPKYRIIMSEQMTDKIVNHLISKYILYPSLEPKLIPMNVATRPGMGTSKGIYYIKKYINHLKMKHDKFYILKCDISKYFYSINHEVLFEKVKKVIHDPDVLNLLWKIICSTDEDYIYRQIQSLVSKEISRLKRKNMDLSYRIKELESLPYYVKGKGLPIGNMTSQILAIYYLNDLDHFIKEKLHIKCYVRYMDDFVLMHEDKQYLRYCYQEINNQLKELKLSFNKKTQIVESHHGFVFLGYRFVLKKKKLYILLQGRTKKKIRKKLKYLRTHHPDNEESVLASYKGYLERADSGSFRYRNHLK